MKICKQNQCQLKRKVFVNTFYLPCHEWKVYFINHSFRPGLLKLDKHFNAQRIGGLKLGSLGATICESLFGDTRFKFGMSALSSKLFSLMLSGFGRLCGFWVFCVLLEWLSGWISGQGGLLTVNVGLRYLWFLNVTLPDPSTFMQYCQFGRTSTIQPVFTYHFLCFLCNSWIATCVTSFSSGRVREFVSYLSWMKEFLFANASSCCAAVIIHSLWSWYSLELLRTWSGSYPWGIIELD